MPLIITGGSANDRAYAIQETLRNWGVKPLYTIRIEKEEEKLSIGAEDIRETLSHLSLLPPGNENQCLLIPDMDILTPQASNALLKTIEEPPSRTFVLISSTNADTLLPTICSRCLIKILTHTAIPLTQEGEKECKKNLSILTSGNLKEKLTFLKKYLKREDALLWIHTFLPYLESQMLSPHPKNTLKQMAKLTKILLVSQDLLSRNIHPILVMDTIAYTNL
ncbi:hypothetical protein HY947_01885 [Candidatus Gottesmanbacteria bacterium]|nr:hypothetical protein [Candidatus Gottesmanbacteria bacterium]